MMMLLAFPTSSMPLAWRQIRVSASAFLLECQQLDSLDGLFEACGIVQTHTNEGIVTFLTRVSNA